MVSTRDVHQYFPHLMHPVISLQILQTLFRSVLSLLTNDLISDFLGMALMLLLVNHPMYYNTYLKFVFSFLHDFQSFVIVLALFLLIYYSIDNYSRVHHDDKT